jgi:hypothetical protein
MADRIAEFRYWVKRASGRPGSAHVPVARDSGSQRQTHEPLFRVNEQTSLRTY